MKKGLSFRKKNRMKAMKKVLILVFTLAVIAAAALSLYNYYFFQDPFYYLKPGITVEKLAVKSDKDGDGLNDSDDILQGARKEIQNKTKYHSAYYKGGYPPSDEGVCADVIWRAMKNAGYDLKAAMDKDIAKNPGEYYLGCGKPDPNIDFRRVKDQLVFFQKYAINLTTKVVPYDKENLSQWQRGDFVVLKNPDHIVVISDKRRKDGVPFIIHNADTVPVEKDRLMRWYTQNRIVGHFRAVLK